MPTSAKIQYTVRGVPPETDTALHLLAKQRGVSFNQLLVEELSAAAGKAGKKRYRSLAGIAGKWQHDPVFDEIAVEESRIDPDDWK